MVWWLVVWWLVVGWRTWHQTQFLPAWGKGWKLQLCNAGIVPPSGQETAAQSITEVAYLQHSESVSWVQANKRK